MGVLIAVVLILAFVGTCPFIHSSRLSERERRMSDRWQ